MPRGDRTGPEGYGPRSGRGLGYCNGFKSPGFTKGTPRFRREGRYGPGFGRKRGYGYRWRSIPEYFASYPDELYHVYNPDDEKQFIERAIVDLESKLKSLRDRLKQIDPSKEDTP